MYRLKGSEVNVKVQHVYQVADSNDDIIQRRLTFVCKRSYNFRYDDTSRSKFEKRVLGIDKPVSLCYDLVFVFYSLSAEGDLAEALSKCLNQRIYTNNARDRCQLHVLGFGSHGKPRLSGVLQWSSKLTK